MKMKLNDFIMQFTKDLDSTAVDMTLQLEEPKRKEYKINRAKVVDADKKKPKPGALF
jgi:hypothetical protein